MARYTTKRPGPHPVAIIEELVQATKGIKDSAIELEAKVQQGYISKLRHSVVPDPQISTIIKLAKALGYRITLAPEKEVALSSRERIVKQKESQQ